MVGVVTNTPERTSHAEELFFNYSTAQSHSRLFEDEFMDIVSITVADTEHSSRPFCGEPSAPDSNAPMLSPCIFCLHREDTSINGDAILLHSENTMRGDDEGHISDSG